MERDAKCHTDRDLLWADPRLPSGRGRSPLLDFGKNHPPLLPALPLTLKSRPLSALASPSSPSYCLAHSGQWLDLCPCQSSRLSSPSPSLVPGGLVLPILANRKAVPSSLRYCQGRFLFLLGISIKPSSYLSSLFFADGPMGCLFFVCFGFHKRCLIMIFLLEMKGKQARIENAHLRF